MIIPRMITRLKPINGITPFTYRNGLTYLEILERISLYIQDVLVREINEKLADVDAQQLEMVNAFNELVEANTEAINQLISDARGDLENMHSEFTDRFGDLENTINGQIDAVNNLIEHVTSLDNGLVNNLAELDEKISEIDQRLDYITWVTPGVPTQFVDLNDMPTVLDFHDLWRGGWPIEYVVKQDATGVRNNIIWPPHYDGYRNIRTGPFVTTKLRLEPSDATSSRMVFDTEYYALHNESRYRFDDRARKNIDADGVYNAFVSAAVDGNGRAMIGYGKYDDHFGGGTGLTIRTRAAGQSGWTAATNIPRPDPGSTSYGTTGITSLPGNSFGVMIHHSAPYRMYFTKTTNGTSWSAPVLIAERYGSSVKWFDDGSANGVLLATSYWGDGITVYASTDMGVSWSIRSLIPQMSGTGNPLNESSIVQIEGDNLLMIIRYSPDSETTNKFMMARSVDMGATWSAPVEIANEISGQPRLTRLPNGDIVTTCRNMSAYTQRKGWGVLTSKDNGVTWVADYGFRDGMQVYGEIGVDNRGGVTLYGATQVHANRSDVWETPGNLTVGNDQTSLDTQWQPMRVHSHITPSYQLGYRKVDGMVYFRGAFQATSIPNPGPITVLTHNLEEWARPPATRRFVIAQTTTGNGRAVAMLEVSTTGHVGISRMAGAAGDTLDGVFFIDGVSYALY